VHSRAALERVHAAMRNVDRRVAKLMQSRLDAIRHHEAELARGQATLDRRARCCKDEHLTPNQVADLDRKWSVIAAPELRNIRAGARRARRPPGSPGAAAARHDRPPGRLRRLETGGLNTAELAASLERMAQEQAAALAAPERASLPRALVAEFASEHARLSAAWPRSNKRRPRWPRAKRRSPNGRPSPLPN
jgi:hypothetical protein